MKILFRLLCWFETETMSIIKICWHHAEHNRIIITKGIGTGYSTKVKGKLKGIFVWITKESEKSNVRYAI